MDGNWTVEDKKRLTQAAVIVVEMQKSYGKEINLQTMLRGWEFILAELFSVDQVLAALKTYLQRHSDIPAPADIVNIIKPPKRKITTAEYYAAKEAIRLGRYYNPHSIEAQTVREFEGQDNEPEKLEPLRLPAGVTPQFKRMGDA